MLPFAGVHDHRIDQKGRVVIPAEYANSIRGEGQGVLFLVPSETLPCLEAYPLPEFLRISEEQVPDRFAESQERRRAFFHLAVRVDLKGPGRIQLPKAWLGSFPNGVVRVAGTNRYLELWDPDEWQKVFGGLRPALPLPTADPGA